MDLINQLGICFKGNYINQGSQSDKCKKAAQINANYAEFIIRNDHKDMDFKNLSNDYNKNIIFHLPTINVNQTNLKEIKDTFNILLKNNISLITIDASTLLYETFDWSTGEEQQNYLKNMARGIASLCENNIDIAIENTDKEKDNLLFGKSVSNLSDLLVYTRNALVEDYNYTREQASKRVGISLNVGKLRNTNDIIDLSTWFKVFYNDIKVVKFSDLDNNIPQFNQLLDFVLEMNLDVPIILETKKELEGISNEFKKFEFLVNKKLQNQSLNFDGYVDIVDSRYNEFNYNLASAQSGYTNAVIIIMIILTITIAALMFILEIKK